MRAKRRDFDFTEFNKRFPSEKECFDYLFKLRWPNGFICPNIECNNKNSAREVKQHVYKCYKCGKQTSITSGTFFDGTHSLQKWFQTLYYMCKRREDATAAELTELIHVSRRIAQSHLKTAESFLYKKTIPLDCEGRMISGNVAVRETTTTLFGESFSICIAVEIKSNKTGRVIILPLEQRDDLIEKYISKDAVRNSLDKNIDTILEDTIARFESWCNHIGQEWIARKEIEWDEEELWGSFIEEKNYASKRQNEKRLYFKDLMCKYTQISFLKESPVTFDELLRIIMDSTDFGITPSSTEKTI